MKFSQIFVVRTLKLRNPPMHTGDPAAARWEQVQQVIGILRLPRITHPSLPILNFVKLLIHRWFSLLQKVANGISKLRIPALKDQFAQVPFYSLRTRVSAQPINTWFQEHGITPNIYAQTAGNEAIGNMVGLGFVVGLVPKIVLDNSPLADKVETLNYQPDLAAYEVGVCVLQNASKAR